MTPILRSFFSRHIRLVDGYLRRHLPRASAPPRPIHEAVRYSVFAGGKRLRPILVIAAADVCGGTAATQVLPAACAMELIHTYSLVHDDLPAMDDDDLRRGKPTNHRVFGEDIAILAGDAMLTQAFDWLTRVTTRGSRNNLATIIKLVVDGAGTGGMIGGQVADIRSDHGRWRKKSDPHFRTPARLLSYIHEHKTAALIRTCLEVGGIASGASARAMARLRIYGESIGLAFQIMDDVLDRIGNKKKLGKKGSDRDNQKLTYPALYGVEESLKKANALVDRSHEALRMFGPRAAVLHALADYIVSRDH